MDYSVVPGWKWIGDKETAGLCESLNMAPQHRLLLLSDGSLTSFLEALNQYPMRVKIKNHKARKIEKEEAAYLEVDAFQDAIIRDVWLIQNRKKLVYASSVFPLAGLDKHFIEEVAAGIEPLGRTLVGHGLSAYKDKREICAVRCIDANRAFDLASDAVLWARRYRLAAQGHSGAKKIKASITEIFSPDIVGVPFLTLER